MLSESFRAEWQPRVRSIVRIMAALLFLEHGLVKLFGFPVAGPATLPPLLLLAGVIETFGSLMLLIGLFTVPVAFIMSGEMAIGYFIWHAPSSFFPYVNKGEDAILFCFVFLYLAIAGGGPWSVDAARASVRRLA